MLGILQNRAYKRAIAARLSGSAPATPVPRGGKSQLVFNRALFACMGRLAKVDGLVTADEIEYTASIMRVLDLNPRERQEAIDFFELGKQLDVDVLLFVEELLGGIGRRSVLASLFLKTLFRLVFVKGGMRLKEKVLLRDVAELLGFARPEFLEICAAFSAGDETAVSTDRSAARQNLLGNAYRVLQLEPGVEDGEIRRAYLRLMSRYHPDKLVQKNLSEEAMRQAQEKSSNIREAYEALCGYRKIRA